ncbi:hypothetical protein [Lacipirellula sp.]|uniref:hypothetical protein n=1 Tax=Lacipirellula sp. TaxID=2691419 RepID=UPI003D0B8245
MRYQMSLTAAIIVCALASASLADPLQKPSQIAPGSHREASHHVMYLHHRHILDHSHVLHDHAMHHATQHTAIDPKTAITHSDEIRRQLNAAKSQVKELEASLTASEQAEAKKHVEVMRSQHAEADKHQTELNAEVAKAKPDAAKIAEQTAAVQRAVTTANAAHAAMMKSQGVTPPKTATDTSVVVKK